MKNQTTEFSFTLKPSKYGIGVFANHDITKESHLRLFGNKNNDRYVAVTRNKKDVPKDFESYCIGRRDKKLLCPGDFGCMEIGWYLNHSKSPNAYHRNYDYYALRDIKAGEEIVIDYNTLEEPEELKDDYYKQ